MLNVGARSIERARVVQSKAAPELKAAVEKGQVSVSAAADIADNLPNEDQRQIATLTEKEIWSTASGIRAANAREKGGRSKREELLRLCQRAIELIRSVATKLTADERAILLASLTDLVIGLCSQAAANSDRFTCGRRTAEPKPLVQHTHDMPDLPTFLDRRNQQEFSDDS